MSWNAGPDAATSLRMKRRSRSNAMRKVALLLGAVCALGLPLTDPASAQQAPPKIAGNWTVKIHSTTEGILEQRWSIKQEGNKITGTAKAKNGDLPLEGA